ncbi:phosphoadenosine phosphosulfate reductase domain-containing protein [Gluconacetobacter entanii]|uniref:Phosphoadenosine phosphosulfate reductase n=1 Tax=Gluconacetobacter entanii TaxID=108528 RepID=A0A318PUX0_9PROT|nr:phosphoadenosine phosphosulfate reductase family protein [Gluconacetobacter entanii]PYD61394.1 phosphoadenosine phosphosulfate reductase [Gluconacetobacter entanii]
MSMATASLSSHQGTVAPEPGEIPDLARYDHVIVACSFGKDSLASTLHLLEKGVAPQRIEWWHHRVDDDGDVFDWPHVPDYGRHLAAALGVRLYFSASQGGIVREMLRENAPTAPVWFDTPTGRVTVGGKGPPNTRRRFPQVSANLSVRWCSPYAKIMVADGALRNQARFSHARTLFVTGEREAESANRARYAVFERHRADCRDGRIRRHIDHWRPVHAWSEAAVWQILRRHGVIPPLPYQLGFGRLSCLTCVFMSADQAATLRHMDPDRFARLCEWERAFGCTIRRDRDLGTLARGGTVYGPVRQHPGLVRRALCHRWRGRVLTSPEQWVLPAGAFGESAGPV